MQTEIRTGNGSAQKKKEEGKNNDKENRVQKFLRVK